MKRILENRIVMRLVLALLYIIPVAIFVKLVLEVRERSPVGKDTAILEWFHHFASPGLDRIAATVTWLGGATAIIASTTLAAIVLYALHKRRAGIVLVIGVGGAAIINTVLKLSFHRVRPSLWVPVVHETSFSFPSGHAMMSSALAFSAIYICWRTRWRWHAVIVGLAYVLIIGVTRLYLGVHYPTDVLGGWIVSLVWLMAVGTILAKSRSWRQSDSS